MRAVVTLSITEHGRRLQHDETPRELCATMKRGLAAATTGTWDAEFGRDLPLHLLNAGLEDVGGEVCTPINIGGSPQSEFFTLSARQASTFVVDTGLVSQADWEEMIAAFEQRQAIAAYFSMVSAWGRRPD